MENVLVIQLWHFSLTKTHKCAYFVMYYTPTAYLVLKDFLKLYAPIVTLDTLLILLAAHLAQLYAILVAPQHSVILVGLGSTLLCRMEPVSAQPERI